MSENCNHDCNSCGAKCSSRTGENPFEAKMNEESNIRKVIAVVSGKGGVGKSMVTSLLAVMASRKGMETAILDADITGPSIPKAFGVNEKVESNDQYIFPAVSKKGIKMMSMNLLLPEEDKPVIWRGPVIAGTVKQFWTDVAWKDVDVMFVDCPPGTGDVPLTVFQSLPVDGIIVVTSPQDLVSMIVAKAVNMAEMMNVPILGIVENMSYFICDECEKKHYIYGESHVDDIAKEYGIANVAKMPMDKTIRELVDSGRIEDVNCDWLDNMVNAIEKIGE